MSISKNILYQKNNFPKVYKSYFKNEVKYNNFENESSDFEEEYENNIIILVEDSYKKVIKNIIKVNLNEDIENSKFVIINKDFTDYEYKLYKKDNGCYITAIHPFFTKGRSIVLVKTLTEQFFKKSSIIICERELNIFEKTFEEKYLKKINYIKDYDSLSDCIIKHCILYSRNDSFKHFKGKVKHKNVDISIGTDMLTINISIKLVKSLVKKTQGDLNINKEIYDVYINEYEKVAKSIIDMYMGTDFNENYTVVEELLKSLKSVSKKLKKEIYNKTGLKIQNSYKSNSDLEKYNLIMESGISKLDKIVSNEIRGLHKKISVINIGG